MNFTFDENLFSDLHKDVCGFRPRSHEFYDADTTDERKQEIWDSYCDMLEDEIEHRKQADKEAISRFEKMVKEVRMMGAVTRATAIRWLVDAEGDDWYDDGYFCHETRLPYHYDWRKGAYKS